MRTLESKVYIYDNQISKMISFVMNNQILDKEMWKRFVDVFEEKADDQDKRWRGEYFGKAMRGACLVYHFNKSKEIYEVLKEAVLNLLATQDELGRISTYKIENEFQSWDMWCRKYVLTGLLHFYDICEETEIKQFVLNSAKKHVDYIIQKIGNQEGQKRITDTSDFWLGVNSSSILEPILDLYKKTGEKRYLDFVTYIVNEGGIKNGNLLYEVRNNIHTPSEYPENKAYETMSFFEGIYEYSRIIKDKELEQLAIKFFEDVNKYEISIIGNAGTNEECFSDTVINQLTKETKFMQETCVVVTWMRILAKLFLTTGDIKYYERFIKAGLNCFYGSLNYNKQKGFEYYIKKEVEPLPFDSYSPLLWNRRGLSTGGLNHFKDGTSYGCCACIGAAGAGLLADLSITEDDDYIYINEYFNGEINGEDFHIEISGNYFQLGLVTINISSKKKVKVRIPEWSKNTILNGKAIKDVGYYLIEENNTALKIEFDLQIKTHPLQDYVALTYGDITLGLDNECNPNIDYCNLSYSQIKNIKVNTESLGDFVTLAGNYQDKKIIIKDYASCGKNWEDKHLLMTAWIKE